MSESLQLDEAFFKWINSLKRNEVFCFTVLGQDFAVMKKEHLLDQLGRDVTFK